MYCTDLSVSVLFRPVLYCTDLYFIVLYKHVLYSTDLSCTVLHRLALYYRLIRTVTGGRLQQTLAQLCLSAFSSLPELSVARWVPLENGLRLTRLEAAH